MVARNDPTGMCVRRIDFVLEMLFFDLISHIQWNRNRINKLFPFQFDRNAREYENIYENGRSFSLQRA